MLHRIADHAKAQRDKALVGCVPALRKAIEHFMNKVKNIFRTNKLAFSVAQLKKRDIAGAVREDSADEDEEDEEAEASASDARDSGESDSDRTADE